MRDGSGANSEEELAAGGRAGGQPQILKSALASEPGIDRLLLQMPRPTFAQFFNDPATWEIIASGQAKGRLVTERREDGKPMLRLDYDFHGGGGFVVARKVVHFALPQTFQISFKLRGDGPSNHFEFKIADPAGANAWRYLRQDFSPPQNWETCRIRERDLPFAWGPAGGGAPSIAGAVELVVAAGPGGKGSISFSQFSMKDETFRVPKTVTATSHKPNQPPGAVFEPSSPSGWQADPDDPNPCWSVDFGRMTRFGGLVIDWPPMNHPRSFEIEISKTGKTWTRLHQATRDLGLRSHIPAPQAEARHLRIQFANAEAASLTAIHLQPDAFSQTPNEFIHAVAADFPRGWFPRYWCREQSYWTPIGSPAGRRRGLINEEGMVEVDEAAFSLEPFLLASGRMLSWADVETRASLVDDGAPFPAVTWLADGLRLKVQPWVDGEPDALVLRINYQIDHNLPEKLRLAVAVRPFQVNPPWQAFRNLGGRSTVSRIACDPQGMAVDERRVEWDRFPDHCGTASFEEGGMVSFLASGEFPPKTSVHDPAGLASAAIGWDVPPGPFEVTVSIPFFHHAAPLQPAALSQAAGHWRDVLSQVEWQVPDLAASAAACFRTAASHILINCDGPAIQPGPRRYTRSWVRDCVIMGAALVKARHPATLRRFLLWYAGFQREDGHVPSVVDRDGVDDLVEHDSHGQFIWGVRESYRCDHDPDFLKSLWPHLKLAAEHLIELRAERMTPEYNEPERAACYGLLPESASHEGYLSHPVHSYWDDFWGIRGLEAAADLASAMDQPDVAVCWRDEARKFLADVQRSMDLVISSRQLDYIPGSVEWADFDPTATANAIAQLDFADALPEGPLNRMLDTYMDGFRRKHRGEIPWLNYTAYEIRIIGAFVRLGRRDEAHELLEFFLSDRRPVVWNQWPEITWRDPRSPGHLGDVPHTWIAAEYLLAFASMVACEREAEDRMVLAQGLSWQWISAGPEGFAVRGLMTRFGALDFEIRAAGPDRIDFLVEKIFMPPGGLSVSPPLPPGGRIASATDSSGAVLPIDPAGLTVTITHLPCSAILTLQPS
jgi:hypothetical protein